MTSGWVTVIGPPAWICCLNNGTTEPDEPKTIEKLKKNISQIVDREFSMKNTFLKEKILNSYINGFIRLEYIIEVIQNNLQDKNPAKPIVLNFIENSKIVK